MFMSLTRQLYPWAAQVCRKQDSYKMPPSQIENGNTIHPRLAGKRISIKKINLNEVCHHRNQLGKLHHLSLCAFLVIGAHVEQKQKHQPTAQRNQTIKSMK